MMNTFTWIPLYKELARTLLGFRDRQPELVHILNEIKHNTDIPIIRLVDAPKPANAPTLSVIDPFTFFATFNRGLKDQNRIGILKILKEKLRLQSDIPTDFNGIPLVDNMQSWFFPYAFNRKQDDIPSLWNLAESIISHAPEQLDPTLFNRCLEVHTVGPAKLTMGLFWLNPESYLALDENNTKVFASAGIDIEVVDHASYVKLLEMVREKLGVNYPSISIGAWQDAKEPVVASPEPESKTNETVKPPSNISYWKIAPGDKAWQWEECRKNHFIAVGWDDFGDLSGVDYSEFEKRFAKSQQNNPTLNRVGSEQLWKFSQIKKGDRIVANRGTTEVVGIGTVTGPYFFVQDVEFGHRLTVRWDDVRPRRVDKGGWKRTLISLDEREFNEIFDALPKEAGVNPEQFEKTGRNIILYGPPGTGKTFNTIERAVQIIEPNFKGKLEEYKDKFDQLRAKGQIEFITFHQSYSYEDFVEGLRPVVDSEEESSEARYQYCPGVFKRLSVRALFDCLRPKSSEAGIVTFDAVWKKLVEQIELEPDTNYPGLTEKTSYRLSLSLKGNIEGTNTISGKTFLCTRSVLEKVFVAKPESKSVSSSDVMEVVVRGCHSHFVAAIFNEMKKIEKRDFAGKQPAPVSAVSLEQKANIVQAFLQQRDAGTYALKPSAECQRYVLVIDEINRGNVSKILGELITLIEPDKRVGGSFSLVVTLPYSGDYFAVPGNLYILGTMNTADKSIALVDVALRRRFEFEELRPNFKICESLNQQMRFILDTLNRRICLRKDRDHQIGHSYFMKIGDEAGFNRVFAKHVIPLLQEYFYNDWEGLRFVLGEKNKTGTFIKPLEGCDSSDARTKWQWGDESGIDNLNFFQTLVGNYQAS
jgi:5-methylcytosine-specific restriction enzyme B